MQTQDNCLSLCLRLIIACAARGLNRHTSPLTTAVGGVGSSRRERLELGALGALVVRGI